MRRGYRGRANNNRAGRFSRQRYQPYPPYHPHNAPPVYIPPPIAPYHPPQPVPTSVPIRKQEPRDQLTATLKMYCEDDVIERVLINNTVNGPPPTHEYQPDLAISEAEQLTRTAIDDARVPASIAPNTLAIDTSHVTSRAVPSVTPVNSVTAPPTQTPPPAVKVSISRPIGHVPVVAPKKAIARPSQRPVTAPVVNMTPQQKEIQLKLAPVQSVPYEGGKSLKFPYDPIEWPKTPKQYVLEWFQRQSSLRVNKQLALIDPQRAAAMSQVPKWEKVSAPALRQGLHLVTLHVTDPRTLQALTFTPDRYWSTVKEAEHVASLMFLQYLLPQANSAKEIHEAMENMQRHQKRLKSTGPVPRKPGAMPTERVGHEVYSAVPPTPQLAVSTRAHDAAPVKQFIDTRHPASVAPKPVPNAPQPSHLPYSNYNHNNINPAVAGYFNPMYMGYYYHYGQHPSYNYPYPPQ